MQILDPDIPSVAPSERGSATQKAYCALRKLILSGALKPGAQLKVDALRKRLDLGASAIREALTLLIADQLVERVDMRGFRATDISKDRFNEILELRCEFETSALRKSIAKGGSDWEDALVLAHHRLCRPSAPTQEAEAHHKAFHLALIGACGSPILLRYCAQLYDLNIRYRLLMVHAAGYGDRSPKEEHQAIFAATIHRNADQACTLLEAHYRTTGTYLRETLPQFAS